MTLDEAIAHAREVASEQKRRSGACVQNDSECDKFSTCLKCAEDHEQLAEWLEELKAIKDGGIPIIHGQEELKLHDREIRNKAINDFAKWLESKKYLMKEIREHDFCYTHYDELKADYVKTEFFAEQLKAGDVD